jgi:hypothetical protein
MNIELVDLLIRRLYPLILGQCVEVNIVGTLNSIVTNPISLETWDLIYDKLCVNKGFVEHTNGRKFLRWKPTTVEEYHYRITQFTYYVWIIDKQNNSLYRDHEIDDFFKQS